MTVPLVIVDRSRFSRVDPDGPSELPQACSSFGVRVQRDKFVPLPWAVGSRFLRGSRNRLLVEDDGPHEARMTIGKDRFSIPWEP